MPASGTQTIGVLRATARPGTFSKNASNRFFVFSLKTNVVREAEVLARRLTWLSSLAFDYLRRTKEAVCPARWSWESPPFQSYA